MIEIALILCLAFVVCSILGDDCHPMLNDVISNTILGFILAVVGAILLALLGVVPLSALSFFFFDA